MEAAPNEHIDSNLSAPKQSTWVASICAYFRDFLDTDFKRTTAPKRMITSRDRSGELMGIPLAKYPEFRSDLLKAISSAFGPNMALEMTVRRGKYNSKLNENLLAVIKKHISSISSEDVGAIVDRLKVSSRKMRSSFSDDPQRYADQVVNAIQNSLLVLVVNPLLSNLATFFTGQGQNEVESIYNIEDELGRMLVGKIEDGMPVAIASAIVDNDFSETDRLIEDACELTSIHAQFVSYFNTYATSDLFNEMSELRSTLKLKDNFQIYVYVCALRFGKTSYPIFYFPIDIALSESIFTISIDPHVLINKKAIDFAISEASRALGRHIAFTIPERIIYVPQGGSIVSCIQSHLDDFTSALSLNGAIDLKDDRKQIISQSNLAVDNGVHLAAFDQGDEGLLNDYEELLSTLNSESKAATDFEDLIKGFMFSEAKSFEKIVDQEWDQMSLPERLVYESPVPLNEEQRKIISGLNASDCRFVAVEGPPGTGKSHTITACVFDAILKGKNVLVLSDKKEALDVVENKIRDTLSKVRVSESFQDPILRLGKHGNTYAKILANKTIQQLKQSVQVARANQSALDTEIADRSNSLLERLSKVESSSTSIPMSEIISVQKEEKKFQGYLSDGESAFQNESFRLGVHAALEIAALFSRPVFQMQVRTLGCDFKASSLESCFSFLHKASEALGDVRLSHEAKKFGRFGVAHVSKLRSIIDEYSRIKLPVLGYLFSGSKVRELNRILESEFDYADAFVAHKNLETLTRVAEEFRRIRNLLEVAGFSASEDCDKVIKLLLSSAVPEVVDIKKGQKDFAQLLEALSSDSGEWLSQVGLTLDNLDALSLGEGSLLFNRLEELHNHIERFSAIQECFFSVPELDYPSERGELELLQTQRLANTIDERVVAFADEHKNKASQIKTIIQKKQKFPKELFEVLREAFPVIIAGIRDYAEYVPLEQGLFDLIIIDEASQVSLAQALPAFVRAKKVLVLGDKNQFSNVKTENASKAINQAYKSSVIDQFTSEEKPDVAMLNQIKMFDIKTSALDYVERIANLKVMLRKHFRGYPELIGFSSKYFYGGALQAVKIRGKSIDDVISFHHVEQDGLIDLQGNTNELEVREIIRFLKELVGNDEPHDVCIITPHSEQQKLFLQSIQKESGGIELIDKLRLRVFTFDTCQGEEAHTVIYSMVATENRDRLNYIFAKDLSGSEEVDENLRLQRLNVGFSRAKEQIRIYHSKPISEFQGGIQTALIHYQQTIEKGHKGPEVNDVDPNSPMEAKVLNWLREVPLIEELSDQVEIDAQFELGAYLKQLDPTYHHPNYKVDFLLKIQGASESKKIIIEYDGFKEHFEQLSEVDAYNYQNYMKPADVERQKILEGYGYSFLRINRFNMGENPVKTLDERLRNLLASLDGHESTYGLVDEYQKLQLSLSNGESKTCKKCNGVKPLEEFWDGSLKNNTGGHGRICSSCKGVSKKVKAGATKSPVGSSRIFLNCPFAEKEEAKALGARWDPYRKKWYIFDGTDKSKFARWL